MAASVAGVAGAGAAVVVVAADAAAGGGRFAVALVILFQFFTSVGDGTLNDIIQSFIICSDNPTPCCCIAILPIFNTLILNNRMALFAEKLFHPLIGNLLQFINPSPSLLGPVG